MKNNKSFLCLIPARGGSKGIPNKNIIDLNGYPLIHYSINTAKTSNIFDRIIVSTDSEDIAKVAKKEGAEVPFLRPSFLAIDNSKIEDTVAYMLNVIEKEDKIYDYVCLLQPTSPLLESEDIVKVVNMLFDKEAEIIVSVGENPINMEWTISLLEDLSLNKFSGKVCGTNRQCFKKTYFLNGAIYLGKWDIFYNKLDYYSQKSYAYIMSYERSIDIDSEFDLKLVEFLMKYPDEK